MITISHILVSAFVCLSSVTVVAAGSSGSQVAFVDKSFRESSLHLPKKDALDTLSAADRHQLQAHVDSLPEPRLLEWADGHREWRTEGEKALVVWHEGGRRFVDVTHRPFSPSSVSSSSSTPTTSNDIPTEVKIGLEKLKPFFEDISLTRMRERLTKFTSFRTRYYRSSTGRESQHWLLDQITTLAKHHPKSNVTIQEFSHSWGQNSIIARFEPTSQHPKSVVVIGAHQDSTNLLPFLPAPGADDDGSGSMTILETFNILLEHGWTPSSGALEFHWYSAEEGGMLGSGALTKEYAAQHVPVRSMLQFDMTAYVKRGTEERVGIVTDFVNPDLSEFVRKLVDEYLTIPWVNTKCGYACSDHSSWTSIGVPSAFGIEATFEDSNTRNIHSTSDRLDISDEFSFAHMGQFVRLALGYVTEMCQK